MMEKILDEFIKIDSKLWNKKIKDDLIKLGHSSIPSYNSKENIKIKPFYTSEDLNNLKNSDSNYPNSWAICQNITADNSSDANIKALELINKGAESMNFIIQNDSILCNDLLKNIDIEKTELFFKIKFHSNSYLKSLNDIIKSSSTSFNISYDPIGSLVKTGSWESSMNEDLDKLNKNINILEKFNNVIIVNSGLYQNSGANIFEEIAFTLSHANEYLNHLNGKCANKIAFNISMGSNYFFEIAKLKALRLLWSTITKEYNNEINFPHIIAKPSKRNKTIYDYNNNILRTTTECMSAILGGANTISNITYDSIFNNKNEYSDKIALNQLLIIKHETYIDKVKNAADGSYYINSLTNTIAEESLRIFKDIENNGGFISALEKNIIQKRIDKSHRIEQELFNNNKEKLLGINIFTDIDQKIKSEINKPIFTKSNTRKTKIKPISEIRLAEEIELSRIKNE
ncbi:MAG: methylmalonyl-CoA mutase [Flavobacteriaceae bacterium]|jgi:methylmalonyl-CoA mutase|uniref:Methylmalonyl-CoA mutase alpha/beta chain catalytic domain-containing protein n=1 Tax=marine metagenome TaxID=408172 RepID=A0A381SND9_9ZZZZ|nr:methylmalonyl-CoA mutase [Flavobacteriaceae bacterium]|tara:strand:- start:3079 stop:4452 length:1374 start_codon:yes stop_codon:yes gene_type:complete